jgi:hypothetical protein
MMRAQNLGASVKTFSRKPEQLEVDDLYRNDVIVCLDHHVQSDTMQIFEEDLSAE